MKWSAFKTNRHFVRAIKLGTITGILVTLGGVIREVWIVLQVHENRSLSASDLVLEGLESRVIVWGGVGILVTCIFVSIVFVAFCLKWPRGR